VEGGKEAVSFPKKKDRLLLSGGRAKESKTMFSFVDFFRAPLPFLSRENEAKKKEEAQP